MPAAQLIPAAAALLFLITGAIISVRRRKLTRSAATTGAILGAFTYFGAGFMGLSLLIMFFLAGTAATSWRKKDKLGIGGSAAHQTTRHAGQVFANGGVAALLGAVAIAMPLHHRLLDLMIASAMSSAMADTLSSELGIVYGRRCFNILTWKKDRRGLDGVVSIEGLLFGLAGSALIAVLYYLFTADRLYALVVICAAGTFGNLADSILGALFERRGLLSNDLVNLLNTLLAAIFAAALVI
ncbi:MAG TPA: DUF92 domain-containing protein [Puia sp.]|nr:DUF92 domain-containing protein [Puia sp.]